MPGDTSPTSIDKAFEICEALSRAPRGVACQRARARSSGSRRRRVHRLLAVLKRRGYVRQDDETSATACR